MRVCPSGPGGGMGGEGKAVADPSNHLLYWNTCVGAEVCDSRGCTYRPRGGMQQGQTADSVSAGAAVPAAEEVYRKTKKHRRSGVCNEDRKTDGSV